jgi:hypothetical protein
LRPDGATATILRLCEARPTAIGSGAYRKLKATNRG